MKTTLILSVLLLVFGYVQSQEPMALSTRYIQVTGSSEMEIEPDEIRLELKIDEYWKEEFDKKPDPRNYRTKVPLAEIETALMSDLAKTGIPKENIITREVGNFWRNQGEEFLMSKQFEIILYDFKKVDEIIKVVNTKGLTLMSIAELKNKNMAEYRKQVKIEALKAAKTKAEYLLQSIGKKTGEVISIVELSEGNNYWRAASATSNTVMPSADDSGMNNVRKIKLRYEMKVTFEINKADRPEVK